MIEHRARTYDRAISWYSKALETDPTLVRAHLGLAEAYLEMGDQARAIESLEKASRLAGNDPEVMGIVGYAQARIGRRRDALALLAEMKQVSERRPVPAAFFADVYIGLGEANRALDLLESACDAHEGRMVQLKVNPRYDPLRPNQRFVTLLKRLNFTS